MATALIGGLATPAHAANYTGQYVRPDGNFAGNFGFVDPDGLAGDLHDGAYDSNRFYVSDRAGDRYGASLQAYDYRNGSWNLLVSEYVGDGQSGTYTRNVKEGQIRLKICVYVLGGDLVYCETLWLSNN